MIQTILIIFGLLAFLDALFTKWNTWNEIEKFFLNVSEKTNVKLFYSLAFCMFCQRFWISVLLTIVFGLISEFSFSLIFIPMIVAGIMNLIKNPA